MKYENNFRAFFSEQLVFTSEDAKRYLEKEGASSEYVRLFLHKLVADGSLMRIKRGVYSFNKNEALTGFAFRPFYYGMEYALTIRKIWAQQADPVIISRTKANQGVRIVNDSRVLIRRINQRAFFGYEYINYSGFFVPVSVPEKILLDFIYFRERLDEETMSSLVLKCNKRIARNFALKLGKPFKSKVDMIFLNYL
ncbi:MAG: type IV toxin-antitoxin system AbiEi family antitoxin domain-containing protein [Thermoplasmata archaeon]